MRAELLSPDAPEWGAFLRDAVHDFYHIPAYARLSAKTEGGDPCAVFVEDGPSRLLLPLVLRGVGDETRRDATSPYGYPGPLVAEGDDAFAREAMASAARLLADEGVVSLFVRGHPLIGPALPAELGTVVEHGPTLSADLTLSPEELWRRTSSMHRNQIQKSLRSGHRVFLDEGDGRLSDFAALYRETMQRVGAADYYLFTDDHFRELREALGPRLRLCVVEIEGEIAAGGLFVETGPFVQYHLSATSARFRREGPTKLMLHFAREWAQERGVRRLHLGGGVGGAEDSLFAFKAGFATDRHCFRTLRVVTDPAAYARLVGAHDPAADPADARGFFPLYRR
jgi:CelD/BcsL family acetyltransferase involved in cellulose biosynthesis